MVSAKQTRDDASLTSVGRQEEAGGSIPPRPIMHPLQRYLFSLRRRRGLSRGTFAKQLASHYHTTNFSTRALVNHQMALEAGTVNEIYKALADYQPWHERLMIYLAALKLTADEYREVLKRAEPSTRTVRQDIKDLQNGNSVFN